MAPITDVVRGDFLNMPFEAATFDAAYAIEATCHAPKVCCNSQQRLRGFTLQAILPRAACLFGCADPALMNSCRHVCPRKQR